MYEEYFRHMIEKHPNLAMEIGGPISDKLTPKDYSMYGQDWWGVGSEKVYWRAWGRSADFHFDSNKPDIDAMVRWLCRQANHEARVIEDEL